MLDQSTVLALAIPIGQAAGEGFAMRQTGTARRHRRPEWTFYAVNVPYWLMIALGIVEHQFVPTTPSMAAQIAGAVLAFTGIGVRIVCHYQLAGGFSPFVELSDNHRLVTTGLYRYIRHPMYVGSLLIFIGVPMVLAAMSSWVMAGVTALALVVRIAKEERLLITELPGYRDYAAKTWRMVPGLW